MMGIVMLETCWAYKKYNKITSGIELVFYSSVVTFNIPNRDAKWPWWYASHFEHVMREENPRY